MCFYTGLHITSENAKDYLEGELKSGRALYNRFTHYSSQSNRTGFADETAQKRKNMIARIQKVLPRLNDEQIKRADNDIHTLTAQNQ
jgi:rubrerythrin